ncbi:hypothetical protein FRACYDRAFT_269358 [Fragilariopsis cylindrus CCMP1102]|uniref:Uncharacterized protein n=1 Tax=Fragilariopsis cylindrus CCMP1102 TaxID=635003 RepID=A0A1E7FBB3_9STRA|nr:hypothetical protein FRACYDRAFT_269358 [Fragilariopsis cylindrus CCMP1102]|eukprot:OEU15436.1 hypothetical protein FRACYDRAFT_269358 [Fragilariopsis cylindrus CCMP1102]
MMWKPGSSKPMKGLDSSALTPNKSLSTTTEGGGTTPSSSSSADKKRLSGSTMNMRFMKRRKDATISNIFKTKENKEKRKSDAAGADASDNQDSNKNNDSSVFQQLQHEEEKVVDMDVDDNNDNNDDDHDSTSSSLDDENFYGQATSVDMFGMEAAIIGRRSFRGFNPAVERIWKDSKACLTENSSSSDIGNNNHKLSDEELLLRYKDSANTSGADSGGRIAIGNLDKKKKKKRR